MRASWIGLLAATILAIGAASALPQDGSVERGREVYVVQRCAVCHSIAGAGGGKMALDGIGSKLKAQDIRKWIRTPREMKADSTMKAYPNLPEKDLNDLIAYLATLR